MRLFFSLLCAALGVTAAEKWVHVTSSNFEVFTPHSERKAREAVLQFEQVREFFESTFGVRMNPTVPVRIVVFGSEKQFAPFKTKPNSPAFYQPGIDRDYIVMGGYRDEDDRVAIHEFVHLLVNHAGLRLPLWLNEGTAELFSTLKPVGNKVQIGALIPGHFYAAAQEKWIPLERLLRVQHADPEYRGKEAGMFYAESWALTHMLQLKKEYLANYGKFSQALSAGTESAAAMEQAFGKPLAVIEGDLRTYLRGNDAFLCASIPSRCPRPPAKRRPAPCRRPRPRPSRRAST